MCFVSIAFLNVILYLFYSEFIWQRFQYLHCVSLKETMINSEWETCRRIRSRYNLKYYPLICLRKTTNNFSQDSQFPGRHLTRDLPNTKEKWYSHAVNQLTLILKKMKSYLCVVRIDAQGRRGCSGYLSLVKSRIEGWMDWRRVKNS